MRAPQGIMMVAIAEPFFHSLVLVFLEARDGVLAYSGSFAELAKGGVIALADVP